MKDYLLVILAVILLAFCFVLQKIYQQKTDDSVISAVDFSIITGIFSAILLIICEGFLVSFTWFSFIYAFLKSACVLGCTVFSFKIMKCGSVAFYMLFLMSGGMLVPSVWGWLFLGEKPKALHIIGVAVILASIILNNVGKQKPSAKLLIMCVGVFILNGFVSVFSKLHQINTTYAAVSTGDYAMLSAITSIIMSLALRVILSLKEQNKKQRVELKFLPVILALIYGIAMTVSSVLQLAGAKSLPASMLYPMITGGSIAFSGIFGLIVLKEKLSVKGWASVILCCIGTCLFM